MKKILYLFGICAAVTVTYLILIIVAPILGDFAEVGATGIETVSGNVTYIATTSTMRALPMVLWFIPGVGGMIAAIVVLKKM